MVPMIDWLRSFLVVLEEGSLNRASTRLHVSQPTLTRRMQSLEAELGGPLLERQSDGVQPTALGQQLRQRVGPLVGRFDESLADLRRQARGQSEELRIGYLGSAAAAFLNPALSALRREHPEVMVRLRDLTPGEQIAGLKAGTIDLALIGQEGASLSKDFYTRRLATLGVLVALPNDHPLAAAGRVEPGDLKRELFLSTPESAVPGRNNWVARICRRAGFRPRFGPEADSIGEAFSLVASEGAVMLVPGYFTLPAPPGTALIPLEDPSATWDLLLIWQRGRAPAVLKAMVRHLSDTARHEGGLRRSAEKFSNPPTPTAKHLPERESDAP